MRSMVEGAVRPPKKTFNRARELRRQMSLPEVVLWQALRKGRWAGLRFGRQHPIEPYILDFYYAPARLAIEVDGSVHEFAVTSAARHGWIDRSEGAVRPR